MLIPNIDTGGGGLTSSAESRAQSGGQFGTDLFFDKVGGTVNFAKKDNVNTALLVGGALVLALILFKR